MPARTLTAFAALLLLFAACAPADREEAEQPVNDTAETPPADLTTTADRYEDAWNGSDVTIVAAFFTEDATVNTDDDTFHGRTAIEQQWVAQNLSVVSDMRATESAWEARNGDWHQHGRFMFTLSPPDQEPTEVRGSFRHDWVQDADGEWRISNSQVEADAPPQATQPTADQPEGHQQEDTLDDDQSGDDELMD